MAATPLNSLSFTASFRRSFNAAAAPTTLTPPPGLAVELTQPTITLGRGAANDQAGGADSCLYAMFYVPAAGSVTIDLQNYTDILQRAAMSMARVKYIEFFHVGTADNASLGRGASQVTVTGDPTGAFDAVRLANGEVFVWGSRKAAGLVLDTNSATITVANDDATNEAAVQVAVVGGSS